MVGLIPHEPVDLINEVRNHDGSSEGLLAKYIGAVIAPEVGLVAIGMKGPAHK